MWVENAFGFCLREPGGVGFGNTVVKRKAVKIIQRVQKTAESVKCRSGVKAAPQ